MSGRAPSIVGVPSVTGCRLVLPSAGMTIDGASKLTPAQRVLRARLAAHASWASTADRTARTRAASDAFAARFERDVDPDGVLDPAERTRRAQSAKKAYFQRLALASSKARGQRAARRRP